MKIIVVEDDADLREQVVTFLSLSGFTAVGVGSASDFYRRLAVEDFSIVVLDLNLPDEDGVSIATHLRSQRNTGIIMATSRNMNEDRIRGFDAGADIYLPKPVDLRELVAAARSLIRRIGPASPPTAGNGEEAPKGAAQPWCFDPAGFALFTPGGRSAHLTANEVSLLLRLTARPGAAASRGDLLAALGYDPADPHNRNLDAAMRRLRLKVDEQTGCVLPIRTVHSIGYLFWEEIRIVQPTP
ncbi:MAG TPA: response regulator transcription factor [Azospirillum sp.]|nr:response regulator transcription factor [Azospirillum sp.]